MVKAVAEARRTQLVSTYGVGSLFPAQDESFMIVGLDDWNEYNSPIVAEPRLARSLDVYTFRMPPARGKGSKDLPVVRFPRIHHCSTCSKLDFINKFCGWDDHTCLECQRTLTPSRFVVCCPNGHIDDFPYRAWVHHGQTSPEGAKHQIRLKTKGQTSSLNDLVVSCSCGVPPRTMAGSFSPAALIGVIKCAGERPWLRGSKPQECSEAPRTLQRGSSNVWFASVQSALSIPPWSEGVQKVVGPMWPVLQFVENEHLASTLTNMGLPAQSGIPVDQLVEAILDMKGESGKEKPTQADLRSEEYQALVIGRPELDPQQQFVCTPVAGLDSEVASVLDGVSEVSRLREVRALVGFTRVLPGGDDDTSRVASLTIEKPTWLPAVEVLGEGIFLRLSEAKVSAWEAGAFAVDRTSAINRAFDERAKLMGTPRTTEVTPREVLLHSFAHIMLSELSLDAGYPVASLRERLFTGEGQTGVLIYTASADSAGSLGGLSAQSAPDRIWTVLQSAVRRATWCSSDPVCIESAGSGADALNLAACHACLLLPETSCERMNTVLDRAMLIGTPSDPGSGFFHDIAVG